jgi:predicted RNA methylase
MKQKHLISALQNLDGFEKPRIELEQYGTPPEIAGLITYIISKSEIKKLQPQSFNTSPKV